MTTTVAVYEMVKEMNKVKDHDGEEEQGVEGEEGGERVISLGIVPEEEEEQQQQRFVATKIPKRKDLCKLLGLIEYDVATDATNPEDIKVAQRVALDNLISVIQQQQQQKKRQKVSREDVNVQGKKKDLAKFLGVDETPKGGSISRKKSSGILLRSNSEKGQNNGFLPNLGQLMKHSIRWRSSESNGHSNVDSGHNVDDLLDLQQLKSASEVVFGNGGRTNRKDLNKFLGLDDSDSEEMVFIQNRKNNSNYNSLNNNNNNNNQDNSLTRSSEQSGNSGVSVVGIRIGSAEESEVVTNDEIFSSEEVDGYSSSPESTLDFRRQSNNFQASVVMTSCPLG